MGLINELILLQPRLKEFLELYFGKSEDTRFDVERLVIALGPRAGADADDSSGGGSGGDAAPDQPSDSAPGVASEGATLCPEGTCAHIGCNQLDDTYAVPATVPDGAVESAATVPDAGHDSDPDGSVLLDELIKSGRFNPHGEDDDKPCTDDSCMRFPCVADR